MLIKRVVILSGDLAGALKLECLGVTCSGMLTLTALHKPCYVVVKVGDAPSTINRIERLKSTFRMDTIISCDMVIVCLIVDDEGKILAKGKLGKNARYYIVEQDCDNFLSNKQSDEISFPSQSLHSITEGLKDKIAEVISASDQLQELEYQEQSSHIDEQRLNDSTVEAALLHTTDGSSEPFYIKVGARLQELFADYPHDDQLEALVHSSQWVRVDYEDSNYYVVGLIKEDETPLFICYGVPVDNKAASQPDNSHCEWLPLSCDDIGGSGYWVLYQDAISGETLT